MSYEQAATEATTRERFETTERDWEATEMAKRQPEVRGDE